MRNILPFSYKDTLMLACAAASLLLSESHAQSDSQVVARLYSTEGKVEARKVSSTDWRSIEKDYQFGAGDAIRTGDASRAAIVNADGMMVRLSSNALLEFKAVDAGVQVDAGDAHFLSRDPHKAPDVTTSIVSGSIRGTEFAISVRPQVVSFSVIQGQVDLKNEKGNVHLESGEQGVTEKGKAPVKRIMVRPFDAVQWALRYPAIVSVASYEDHFSHLSTDVVDGFRALKNGDYAEADNHFAGRSDPALLGKLLVSWARDGAIKASQRAAQYSGPKSPAYNIFEAGLALETGEVERATAIHSGLRGAKLPADLQALLNAQRAVLAIVNNKREEARELLDAGRREAPNTIELLYAESLLNQAYGDIDGASVTIGQALERDPNNPRLLARAAELAFAHGEAVDAEKLAEASLQFDSENVDARTVLGFIYLARAKIAEAHRAFDQALASNDAFAPARLGLGITTIREGQLAEGRTEIQKAVHLEPTTALFRSYLAKAFFEQAREDQASEELKISKQLDEKDPTPYLYEAFNNLAMFRPVDALGSAEDSIERNENRAVYRSRLLLDQDQATRSAGIGRVFAALDFVQPARIEALKSLSEDPTNYSAHLLLKDSLLGPDSDSAAIVEDVTATLLSPSTASSLLPVASSSASLNEYTTLFEQGQSRSLVDLNTQTKDRLLESSLVHFGGGKDYSYLLRYGSSYADGYRDNDFQHFHSGRILTAADLTADDKVLVEAIGTTSETGDVSIGLHPDENDSGLESDFDDVTARVGYRHTFGPGSQFLSQAAYINSRFVASDSTARRPFDVSLVENGQEFNFLNDSANFDSVSRTRTEGLRSDAQWLWNSEFLSVASGAALVSFNELDVNTSFADVDDIDFLQEISLPSRSSIDARAYRAYSYLTAKPTTWIRVTGGANYSTIDQSPRTFEPFVDRDREDSEWSPRLGIMMYPTSTLTLRAAYFEQLGTASTRDLETLEPSQVSGLQTVYDDNLGAQSENWGMGVDWKMRKSTYVGTEFLHRRIRTPMNDAIDLITLDTSGEVTYDIVTQDNTEMATEQHVVSYLNQVITRELVGSIEHDWSYTDDELYDYQIRTNRLRMGLNYFHPSGLFLFGSTTWRDQNRENVGDEGDPSEADFWIVSGGVGWQLPHRHGAVQLAVRNVFDNGFKYEPTTFDDRLAPGADVSLRVNLNF